MQQAAVTDVDLRRLHDALAHVLGPRPELIDDKCTAQQVEIPADGRMRDAERAAELRRVPDLPVIMGQHRPEPLQRRDRHLRAEPCEVTLQKRADEITAPLVAPSMGASEVGARESAAEPQTVQLVRADLLQIESGQLVEGDAPRQRLRSLAKEIGRRASENQETRGCARAVGQHAEDRKEVRTLLDLIEDNEPTHTCEPERGLLELRQVTRIFQVEERDRDSRSAGDLVRQRRLPDLPCAQQRDDRLLAQQPLEASEVSGPLEVSHALKSESHTFRFQGICSPDQNLSAGPPVRNRQRR